MTDVNKLGGSCLRSVDDFQKIHQIITSESCILVVSASHGTTNTLLKCLNLASMRKNYLSKIKKLITEHLAMNKALAKDSLIHQMFLNDQSDILALLNSVSLLGHYSQQQRDWLLGYGEYWSSRIVASMLGVQWLDSGQIITVQRHESSVTIDWKETQRRLKQAIKHLKSTVIVMPGFVARDDKGLRALLGFNGSDFTAAIIAKLIKAKNLYKWTDVDGIFTADPKLVKSAFAIPQLSYQEAAELAYFGASVLHPQSVQPAIDAKIPIHIKNYFKVKEPGTVISASPERDDLIVKGLSSISNVSLINIEGTGLVGIHGIAGRLFSSLSKAEISVILISQASSEHSISIVVEAELGDEAVKNIEREFEFELQNSWVQKVSIIEQCAVVSAVGDRLLGTPGVAAKFFKMIAEANVNILAIAQGSSERNISTVIKQSLIQRTLRSLHGGFYLSNKTLSIGIIGPGGVGSELLDQIKKNRARLKREMNVDLRVRGIMNSKMMLLHDKSSEMSDWQESMKAEGVRKNIQGFIQHLASNEIPNPVLVDCTSSAEIATLYISIIEGGCHIVTPNKKANSSDLVEYNKLKLAVKTLNRHYLYETTVCAGLPIIKTIQDLIATGDVIHRIEGVVSGTLSYIFNQCAQGISFADSVRQAYELGYTEPDPRDDLNGLDVARKFVCLGRELGYDSNLADVTLLNMVPEALRETSVKDFLKKLPEHQQEIEQKIKKLLHQNAAIAYVGEIVNGKITIDLNSYPVSHPFANISGTDNILLIQSRRYDKQTLIIQGPGAGKDVTAAGVFADILKLASML